LQLLVDLQYPQILFSAFDFERSDDAERHLITSYFETAKQMGCAVLLDSGNYEAFWKADASWAQQDFRNACQALDPSFAFCFDDQNPPADREGAAAASIACIRADSAALPTQNVFPIVHGTAPDIPSIVWDVVSEIRPQMVAVPERELGDGMLHRCRTLAALRTRLNELDYYCPIHLPGTGNPHSILAFVLCGADSFDGLEWCQTVVDYTSGRLSHFQHWDLYSSGSPLVNVDGIPYQQKTLAHNLVFWAELMRAIRDFLKGSEPTQLIKEMLEVVKPVLPASFS